MRCMVKYIFERVYRFCLEYLLFRCLPFDCLQILPSSFHVYQFLQIIFSSTIDNNVITIKQRVAFGWQIQSKFFQVRQFLMLGHFRQNNI